MKKSITILLLIAAAALGIYSIDLEKKENFYLEVAEVTATSPDSIRLLSGPRVAPVQYHEIEGLSELSPKAAKLKFISALLPSILITKHEILTKRNKLDSLIKKEEWSVSDSIFFEEIADYYRTMEPMLLYRRMRTHPNSIILAQAAVESGWGSSRIFQQGNNLFGVWSYRSDEPRIKTNLHRKGTPIYLRRYNNLSESIHDYFGVVARAKPYKKFREARDTTDDVNTLLPLLRYYSELRDEYVVQLATIIRQNDLMQYDSYTLDSAYFRKEKITKLFGHVIDSVVVSARPAVDGYK